MMHIWMGNKFAPFFHGSVLHSVTNLLQIVTSCYIELQAKPNLSEPDCLWVFSLDLPYLNLQGTVMGG